MPFTKHHVRCQSEISRVVLSTLPFSPQESSITRNCTRNPPKKRLQLYTNINNKIPINYFHIPKKSGGKASLFLLQQCFRVEKLHPWRVFGGHPGPYGKFFTKWPGYNLRKALHTNDCSNNLQGPFIKCHCYRQKKVAVKHHMESENWIPFYNGIVLESWANHGSSS